MKLLNKLVIRFCLVVSVVFLFESVSAQCKRYTKNHCLPSLSPYMHNGQLTSAVFNPGDSADIAMTFNAGKDYRLLICSQEQIGEVKYQVMNKSRKVLYEGTANGGPWDFKVNNTQQFIIKLNVEEKEKSILKHNLVPTGCISILIGFKE